jgi:hypothetical protein
MNTYDNQLCYKHLLKVSADELKKKKKKAQGNDVYSKNSGAQGLKIDNKEQSLSNSRESFDSKNEESRGGVSVLSASKKPKLHWGYSSLTLLSIKRKMHLSHFIINLDLL